jgi:polyphosphate kinase
MAQDPEGESRFFNRELSWLAFNSRVLAQAEDERLPLLERLKFLAIWGSNLDEFFMVRVANLKEQISAGSGSRTPDGRTPAQQLIAVRAEVDRQSERVRDTYGKVVAALAETGLAVVGWDDLGAEDRSYLGSEYEHRIFPVLTPLAVDPGHPFPYVSNQSLSLAVMLRDPLDGNRRFARLKVPQMLGRFLALPDGNRFIPIEDVVRAHLGSLFPGMEVIDAIAFRVTRNADLEIDEDEAADLLSAVELQLSRRRFQRVVRMEVGGSLAPAVRELLVSELELEPADVYVAETPLALTDLWELYGHDRPDLKDAPFTPVVPMAFRSEDDEPADIFALLRERDVLVHHPYESFNSSVQELIRQAANDPAVQAIKLTLYRTSGDSPLVDHLIRAAERGKQVAVVVELKARFDEAANIAWARRLEDAGVHVAYGLVGLKVHCKTCLVVRAEAGGVRRYCHVGTGNYNSLTARFYTDFGFFTADYDIGDDLSQLFNTLTGYGRNVPYRRLVVAPEGMRRRLAALIDNERACGESGRIALKMNSLVDSELIDHLYAASQHGVRIDLLIRGICCLRPGVAGLSENIRVRSVVGRYLEHPRVYRFSNGRGPGQPVHLIGSADFMPRNLDRRVEALVPIDDPRLRRQLDQVLEVGLADQYLAWDLDSEGGWTRASGDHATNSQSRFEDLARGLETGAAMIEVHAAGAVLIRDGKVLLVHRPRHDDWTFPKGKLDPGEAAADAAVRELREETGLWGVVDREIRSTRYLDDRGRRKQVRYWLMRDGGGEFTANDEVDELIWVTPEEAERLLTYTYDIEVLEDAVGG